MKNYSKTLFLFPLLLSGCSFNGTSKNNNDDKKNLSSRNVPIINVNKDDFNITGTNLTIWYIEESDVPYVAVDGFFTSLDGFFDSKNIAYEKNEPSCSYSVSYKNESTVNFDWDSDVIWSNSLYSFNSYSNDSSGTNYGEHLYSGTEYSYGNDAVRFNIGKYYFDILFYKGTCIVPLFIMNLLFCSTQQFNVFYNYDNCYCVYGETTEIEDYYESQVNRKVQSSQMRTAAVNSLLFVFDYFYGLKEHKEYKKAFKYYINSDVDDLLWSKGAADNYEGYKKIIYGMLDELHTRIDLPSYYCDPIKAKENPDDYGYFYKDFYANDEFLSKSRKIAGIDSDTVRYKENTAIITLNSFRTGSHNEIYSSQDELSENAWKYDSYYFMRKCLKEIETKGNVSDIVLDLSLNGGGNIGAMYRVLGFITDQKILSPSYNFLSHNYEISKIYVDTDGDGNYSNDVYDNYKWYFLTGIRSFSAANFITSIFKQMNLGKTIGKRTGGGMCSVMPLVLADGTGITISSPNSFRYYSEEEGQRVFYSIENGLKPDIDLAYDSFYDDLALINAIGNNSYIPPLG